MSTDAISKIPGKARSPFSIDLLNSPAAVIFVFSVLVQPCRVLSD